MRKLARRLATHNRYFGILGQVTIRVTDYAQTLTDNELTRLKAIFPNGVCDYSRPGVSQEVTKTFWQSF